MPRPPLSNCGLAIPCAQERGSGPATPRKKSSPSATAAAPPPSTPITPSGVGLGLGSPGGFPPAAPAPLPLLSAPQLSIPGAAGVHQYAIMPDKLQVLTEDTSGNATVGHLWR